MGQQQQQQQRRRQQQQQQQRRGFGGFTPSSRGGFSLADMLDGRAMGEGQGRTYSIRIRIRSSVHSFIRDCLIIEYPVHIHSLDFEA